MVYCCNSTFQNFLWHADEYKNLNFVQFFSCHKCVKAFCSSLGDVIVDINGTCVLGKTHADVVQMFQSIPVNQYVDMVLCRGYPLPEDTSNSEEASSNLSASKDTSPSPSTPQDLNYAVNDGATLSRQTASVPPMTNGGRHHHPHSHQHHHLPHALNQEGPDPTLLQPELVSVPLVKGPGGFGFAIADCPLGQKVKMILDAQWCRGLLKGDVIKEINRQNVQTLSHSQVVDILKDLPVGSEVNVLVLRGGESAMMKVHFAAIVLLYTSAAGKPATLTL